MDSLRFTVAKYNIHITNVNPGPVHTSFGSKLPQQKGSRVVPQDPEDYITSYMDTFLDSFHAYVLHPACCEQCVP